MEIKYNGKNIQVDDRFSFKSFVNQTLKDSFTPQDFAPGMIIYRSSFYHEKPNSETFHNGMYGVTFIHCNLDNVYVPPGNILEHCSQNVFKSIDGIDQFLSPDLKKVLGPVYVNKNDPLPWYKRFLKWLGI